MVGLLEYSYSRDLERDLEHSNTGAGPHLKVCPKCQVKTPDIIIELAPFCLRY